MKSVAVTGASTGIGWATAKVRYQIVPDPMRHLMAAILPKRMVDKIIAKRLGLIPRA